MVGIRFIKSRIKTEGELTLYFFDFIFLYFIFLRAAFQPGSSS